MGGGGAPKGSRAQPAYAVFPPQQLKNGCPSPLFEVPCRRQQNFFVCYRFAHVCVCVCVCVCTWCALDTHVDGVVATWSSFCVTKLRITLLTSKLPPAPGSFKF